MFATSYPNPSPGYLISEAIRVTSPSLCLFNILLSDILVPGESLFTFFLSRRWRLSLLPSFLPLPTSHFCLLLFSTPPFPALIYSKGLSPKCSIFLLKSYSFPGFIFEIYFVHFSIQVAFKISWKNLMLWKSYAQISVFWYLHKLNF